MKVKTADLAGPALDWAVAKCENQKAEIVSRAEIVQRWRTSLTEEEASLLNPPKPYLTIPGVGQAAYSTSWAQGGPILEREQIKVVKGNPLYFPQGNEKGDHYEPLWIASLDSGKSSHGRSYLEAAMRCYMASKLGDEVDVPKGLI